MATDLQIAARKVSSVNPATGETLREFDCAGEEEVRAAVVRARAAQGAWYELGLRHRVAVLRDGRNAGQLPRAEISHDRIVSLLRSYVTCALRWQ